MLITSELSEALEAHRKNKYSDKKEFFHVYDEMKDWGWDENTSWYFEDKIKGCFEEEIADVLIRIFDLCGYYNIDEVVIRGIVNYYKDVRCILGYVKVMKAIIFQYLREMGDRNTIKIRISCGRIVSLLLRYCKEKNIDIEKFIQVKMAYNRTRPYKHNKEY